MGLKMKKLTIMRVHQFLGEGVRKKTIYRGVSPEKGDFDSLQGTWEKRERRVFLRGEGLIPQCTLWLSCATCQNMK